MGYRIILAGLLLAAVSTGAQPTAEPELNSPTFWIQRTERDIPKLDQNRQFVTYEWLARAYASLGDRAKFRTAAANVKKLAPAIQKTEYRARVLASLALDYSDAGDDVECSRTLRDAAAIDPKEAASLGLQICHRFIDSGRLDRALDCARKGETPFERARRLADVAVAQAKAGRKPYAAATFREALSQTDRAPKNPLAGDINQVYFHIAESQVEAGDYDGASHTSQKLLPARAAEIEVDIAEARLAAKDRAGYASAIESAIDLNAKGETDNGSAIDTDGSWAAIARAAVLAGDEGHVHTARQRAGKLGDSVEFSANFQRAIMRAEAGDADGAISLMNAALAMGQKRGELPDAHVRQSHLPLNVMEALAKAGKHQAAMELATRFLSVKGLQQYGSDRWIYSHIAASEAEAGQFGLAQMTMLRISDTMEREEDAERVLLAAIKAGTPLEEPLKWIDSFTNVEPRSNTYMIVGVQLIKRSTSHAPASQP